MYKYHLMLSNLRITNPNIELINCYELKMSYCSGSNDDLSTVWLSVLINCNTTVFFSFSKTFGA